MADEQPPPHPDGPGDPGSGAHQGWAAVSYLIGGIAVWGFLGWLIDQWLDLGGIPIGIGAVLGAAGGIYLIARRLGGV